MDQVVLLGWVFVGLNNKKGPIGFNKYHKDQIAKTETIGTENVIFHKVVKRIIYAICENRRAKVTIFQISNPEDHLCKIPKFRG